MIRKYYQLTKPGIIYGNLLTATGGFLMASRGDIDLWLMAAVLAGTSLVIASACVINNYIDRNIDAKMARTKQRALAIGSISSRAAFAFAATLGLLGFLVLALATNPVTLLVGVVGYVDYLVFYTIWKRRSTLGTAVGSIAGATPVVAGYTAVTGAFDGGALILFLILALWQMPHFYSIAIYRRADYLAAGLPVLPVKSGVRVTKMQMVGFIAAFIAAATLLAVFGYAGYTYLAVMLVLGLNWLRLGMRGFKVQDNTAWARGMFKFSLVVILGFSLAIGLDAWLP